MQKFRLPALLVSVFRASTLLSLLSVLAGTGVRAQARLVESVSRKGDELVIPFQKYVLPNGLTVILTEDHSDPLVHIDVSYHVGSAREEIGKSGFAHFFEHMMFEGSDHVSRGDHFKIVSSSGGNLNGTTDKDRTHYFESVPNNQLEKMLWLESDRMGFLLDAVTQQKFENQRATVKNERGQNYDNRPYGLAQEAAAKAMYPYGHPYSWLTIGYIEDLNRVDVNDLKRFFLRWYGPNNATLTIGGDIDPKQTLAWVEKYFGSIPRGPEVKKTILPAPSLTSDRYVSYTDNYARMPLLLVSFPGVKLFDKDQAALDALSLIIGGGNSSMLYQAFVKSGKALQATMQSPNSELAGTVNVIIVTYPGQSLAQIKKQLDSVLNAFEQRGVSDDDLARYKSSTEADYVHGLESVEGKVNQLAMSELMTGDPNHIKAELSAIRAVTKADVMRVYHEYIKGKPAVILSVLPKTGNSVAAGPDNYTVDSSHYHAPDYGYAGLAYHKPVDIFDRSVQPPAGPNPVVKVPEFWRTTTTNGIQLIGSDTREIPAVTLDIDVKGGPLWAEKDSTKAGIAAVVAQMLNEGTEHYTSEQMSDALDKLGSSINVRATNTGIRYSLFSLTKNLDATLALLQERLFHPKFTEEDFDRIKRMTMQGFQQRKSQAAALAGSVINRLLYAPGSVRPYALGGTEATVARLTLADVQAFYNSYFASNLATVEVVGDIAEKDAREKLGFLNSWTRKDLTVPAADTLAAAVAPKTIYLVDVPHAAQSEIRVAYLTGINYDPTGLSYRLSLMDYPLGGGFVSRVNLDLREDKGWTYGAYAFFNSGEYGGNFVAQASVKAASTDSSVAEMLKVIDDYSHGGMTPAELTFTKNSIGQSDALKYETNEEKAGFLANMVQYHLDANYVAEQQRILNAASETELNQLAARYLDTSKMTILVVGDKAHILPGLQRLGYPIVEVDDNGQRKP